MRLLSFAGLLLTFCVSTVLSTSNFKIGWLWSHEIPYTISKSFIRANRGNISIVLKAMEEFDKTCYKFVPRTNQKDYIFIDDRIAGTCDSDLGRRGGMQEINLADGCVTYNAIVHELMHTIGFNHEHQRPDRDEYVIIHKKNIIPSHLYAFERMEEYQAMDLGVEYDFQSIMHYNMISFNIVPGLTIEAKNMSSYKIWGNKPIKGLSKLDLVKLNKICKLPLDGSDPCFDKNPEHCAKYDAKDTTSLCKKKDADMIKSCRKSCGICTTLHKDVKDSAYPHCAKRASSGGYCTVPETFKTNATLGLKGFTKAKYLAIAKRFQGMCKYTCYCKKRAMQHHCEIPRHKAYMMKNCREVCKYHDSTQISCTKFEKENESICEKKTIYYENVCSSSYCDFLEIMKF